MPASMLESTLAPTPLSSAPKVPRGVARPSLVIAAAPCAASPVGSAAGAPTPATATAPAPPHGSPSGERWPTRAVASAAPAAAGSDTDYDASDTESGLTADGNPLEPIGPRPPRKSDDAAIDVGDTMAFQSLVDRYYDLL